MKTKETRPLSIWQSDWNYPYNLNMIQMAHALRSVENPIPSTRWSPAKRRDEKNGVYSTNVVIEVQLSLIQMYRNIVALGT